MSDLANAGLDRIVHIIAESEDPDAAEQQEWETRDQSEESEDDIDPNTDPSLWEGADPYFEFDDEDWEALTLAIEGRVDDLNPQQKSFLTDAGMIADGKVTVFGKKWHEEMSHEDRKGELPDEIVDMLSDAGDEVSGASYGREVD